METWRAVLVEAQVSVCGLTAVQRTIRLVDEVGEAVPVISKREGGCVSALLCWQRSDSWVYNPAMETKAIVHQSASVQPHCGKGCQSCIHLQQTGDEREVNLTFTTVNTTVKINQESEI